MRVKVPQIRGQAELYRSPLWTQVSRTSEVLKKLIVEMYVGGMSQRDIEQGVESTVGQFLLSKSTVSDIAESLADEYEAFRTRDLRQEPVAYLSGGARVCRRTPSYQSDPVLVDRRELSALGLWCVDPRERSLEQEVFE